MATIGQRLSEARKNFGIDIRSASEATKIRSDFLAALEEDKPERIRLADVYKVGFLRIYSNYLKLDADRLVAEFRTALSFQSAPAKGHRNSTRSGAGSADSASAADGGSIFAVDSKSGFSFSALFRNGGSRLAVVIGVAVIVAVVVIFGIVKFTGGNAENSVATQTVATLPTPDTQVYEFQVISKVPQKVVISDCYGATTPGVESATLFDRTIPANKPQLLEGRGVLLIKDGGNENLEIRFPTLEKLQASKNADVPVKFEESDEENSPFRNKEKFWTANPYYKEDKAQ